MAEVIVKAMFLFSAVISMLISAVVAAAIITSVILALIMAVAVTIIIPAVISAVMASVVVAVVPAVVLFFPFAALSHFPQACFFPGFPDHAFTNKAVAFCGNGQALQVKASVALMHIHNPCPVVGGVIIHRGGGTVGATTV